VTTPPSETLAGAYAGGGGAWALGPALVYDRLAEALVAKSPVPITGRLILDCGAGTGAATRAIAAAGGEVVALDLEPDMLRHNQTTRPLAIIGSMLALPFLDNAFGGGVAAFSLNHVETPVEGLRELNRVTMGGGPILAAVFSTEQPAHPAKQAIEDVARTFGYVPPNWYARLKRDIEPLLGSVDRFTMAARDAGLDDVIVTAEQVDTGIATADGLVRWRLGMAHLGAFVQTLDAATRARLVVAARTALGPRPQPLVSAVLMLSSRAAA
jgi:ubiquinone/menaquinone biosynthesis C-methylase UbiE